MNPVTRRLLDEIDDPALAEFALAWDEYEEHFVGVFREGGFAPAEAAGFDDLRRATQHRLRNWEPALEQHWRATRIEGVHPEVSPFRTALAVDPASIPTNRAALRALPAAREALNMLLLERAAGSRSAANEGRLA
jgi:hypothetical protein